MAVIFTEGFDYYREKNEIIINWSSTDATTILSANTIDVELIDLSLQPQHKRFPESKKCLKLRGAATTVDILKHIESMSPNEFVFGCAIKYENYVSSNSTFNKEILNFYNVSGNSILRIVPNLTSGTFSYKIYDSNNTLVGETTASAFSIGQWHYLEIEASVSSQSTVKVFVDNNNIGTFSSVDLLTTGDTSKIVSSLKISKAGEGLPRADVYFDDMYMLDSSPGQIIRLGPSRIDYISVSSVVTSNFSVIGDIDPAAALRDLSNSKFIETSATNTSAVFTVENFSHSFSNIYAVNIITRASKLYPKPLKTEITLDNGTNTTNYEIKNIQSDLPQKLENIPAPSGSSWTKSELESLLVKFRRKL